MIRVFSLDADLSVYTAECKFPNKSRGMGVEHMPGSAEARVLWVLLGLLDDSAVRLPAQSCVVSYQAWWCKFVSALSVYIDRSCKHQATEYRRSHPGRRSQPYAKSGGKMFQVDHSWKGTSHIVSPTAVIFIPFMISKRWQVWACRCVVIAWMCWR